MPLATTAGTPVVKTEPLSKYEIDRNERHATSQAGSNAKRKAKNAPRRDDIARIGLFLMLMQYRGSKHDGARTVVRKAMVDLLTDAGFSATQAGEVFDKMVLSVGVDLDRYFMLRRIEPAVRNRWRDRNGLPALPNRSAADTE
jgi:hypothetical protein